MKRQMGVQCKHHYQRLQSAQVESPSQSTPAGANAKGFETIKIWLEHEPQEFVMQDSWQMEG